MGENEIELVTKPAKGIKSCYACLNGLTGDLRRDGSMWECFCQKVKFYECFCPLCEDYFVGSDFLFSQIKETPDLWLANMITHYRHEHRQWDNQWRYISRFCRQGTYEKAKEETNNQIKRVFLRKKEFLNFAKSHGVTKNSFSRLLENDEKTIKLIEKKFKF